MNVVYISVMDARCQDDTEKKGRNCENKFKKKDKECLVWLMSNKRNKNETQKQESRREREGRRERE